MKKCLVVMTTLALVAVLAAGCAGAPTPMSPTPAPAATPSAEKVNFRLWISDEVNNIDHFDSLSVTITGIGVVKSGGGDNVTQIENFPGVTVDLKDLQDDNATLLWDGQLDDGDYTKVFLYVNDVTGILDVDDEDGEPVEAEVKLPSEKLQISKPFTISSEDGQVVNFVCDVTVVKAGKKDVIGGKYILKPQLAASGTGQNIVPVASKGKPEKPGKPEEQGELNLEIIEEDIAPGDSVTLWVTFEDEDVAGAMVKVNGTKLDNPTGEDGKIIFTIPADAHELEIKVKKGKLEGELRIEFQEQGE